MKPMRRLVLGLCLLCSFSARAGTPPGEEIADRDLQALVTVLEDDTRRAELIRQLRTLIDAQNRMSSTNQERLSSVGALALEQLSARMQAVGSSLMRAGMTLAHVPQALAELAISLREPAARAFWLELFWKVAAALAAGGMAERLVRRLLARSKRTLATSVRERFWKKLVLQTVRLFLDLVEILVFGLCAYGVVSLVHATPTTRLVALALINASLLARGMNVLARVLLSPSAGGLRLIAMADETASYWWVWIRRFSNLTIYGYIGIETGLLLGLSIPLHDVLIDSLGVVIMSMLMMLAQQNRRDVARLIAGPEHRATRASALRGRLSRVWHVIAFIYLAAVYVVWASDLPGGFTLIARASLLTLVILVVAIALGRFVGELIDRGFRLNDDLRLRFPLLEQRSNRYLPVLKTGSSLVIGIVALGATFQAWDLDVLGWVGGEVGRAFFARIATIGFIIAAAFAFWEIVSTVIEHFIDKEARSELRSARLQTLLPLAQKATMAVLVLMVSLIVLSEVGVNIAPLLAGAGVVGLAIGFGAQTLVKDIITGVFILIEDSISVGDYIEVGGHAGTVESMSMRTIRMRDAEGNVHTVPFGEVNTVKNFTRDYGYAVMDIAVAHREDVDRVTEVLNRLGEEILEDPEWSRHVLEPMLVEGLQSLADAALIIRARIKTVAGMQASTRRELYKRIKKRFDEVGIEIPSAHRTLHLRVDETRGAPVSSGDLEGAEERGRTEPA